MWAASLLFIASVGIAAAAAWAVAGEPPAGPAPAAPSAPSAERGYRFITEKPYVPASFEQTTFDAVWEVWPADLRARAEKATPDERRKMAYERYGLTPRPGDAAGKPLQYAVDEQGRWTITCFACHAGQVAETTIPGLPNAHVALQDLVDDIGRVEVAKGIRRQLGGAMLSRVPLGETHGTTNAVMFSVALLAFRDADLNVVFPRSAPRFVHHDLDAPPWWNVQKRKRLYLDGLVVKGHRSLMQFLLVPTNGPARLAEWEPDFKDILAYIESVRAPAWPFEIDRALAARGKVAFEATCSRCHGTYGEKGSYPEVMVPIDVIGTDRLRHDAVDPAQRKQFADSWFTEHDPSKASTDPAGYVAPPLDGIWASAPYFHNGSVPTLCTCSIPTRARGHGA